MIDVLQLFMSIAMRKEEIVDINVRLNQGYYSENQFNLINSLPPQGSQA